MFQRYARTQPLQRHPIGDCLALMAGGGSFAALETIGFRGGLALDLYKQDYERVAPGALAYLRQLAAV